MTIKEKVRYGLRYHAFMRGDFTLASGAKSEWYVNCRRITTHPDYVPSIGALLADVARSFGATYVGGPEVAAIPLVTATAVHGLKGFWVRKTKKGHGVEDRLDGCHLVAGSQAMIVDDVATSGQSILDVVRYLMGIRLAPEIVAICCLVDRKQGAAELFAKELPGVPFVPLFTADEVML